MVRLPRLFKGSPRETAAQQDEAPPDERSPYDRRLEDFLAALARLSERQTAVVGDAWGSLSKPQRDAAWEAARGVTRSRGVPAAKPSAEAATGVQRWASHRPDDMSSDDWARIRRFRGRAVPALIGAGVAIVLGDDLDAESSRILLAAWHAAQRYGTRRP